MSSSGSGKVPEVGGLVQASCGRRPGVRFKAGAQGSAVRGLVVVVWGGSEVRFHRVPRGFDRVPRGFRDSSARALDVRFRKRVPRAVGDIT